MSTIIICLILAILYSAAIRFLLKKGACAGCRGCAGYKSRQADANGVCTGCCSQCSHCISRPDQKI